MRSLRRVSSGPSVGLMILLLGLTAATWWWQLRVFRPSPTERPSAPRDHGPTPSMSGAPEQAPSLFSKDMADAIIRANPFSPQRRAISQPPDGSSGGPEGQAVSPAAQPRFSYKGRIQLGARQRAILEDTTSHKTYFLEVGQEVTGFKVLDIAENRVVLSNDHTHEEVVVPLASTALPSQPAAGARQGGSPSPLRGTTREGGAP